MSRHIDLDYRPTSYFRPVKLEQYLLSKVKGTAQRRRLQQLFEEGRHTEVADLIEDFEDVQASSKALESVHPMFMGGNYLPDLDEDGVEIARITIESTTRDVTCVYAWRKADGIFYRVVDEYGGDTLDGPAEARTTEPMTLRKLTDFFLTAWPLLQVLEMNFEDDLQGALRFFSAESYFYPAFGLLCQQRMIDGFRKD
jgi:hypothetical protein